MERVRKAATGGAWPGRRISAADWQAGERAAALLADARAEAAGLRRDAEREVARWREEAASAGHAEGLAGAAAALLDAEARRDAWLAGAHGELVDLALEVARRLVGPALALAPAEARALAASALSAARGRRRATLRLHPDAAAALAGEAGALAAVAALPSLQLLGDPSLAPGDAVVETDGGTVDARLAVRLEAFRRALNGLAA